jgi:large subunit ribosomal protein L35
MKTHSGAKHRFTVTGTGKYMRVKGSRRHLKNGKAKRTLAADEKKFVIADTYRKMMRKLLPYG